ncbi:hypothetical protein BJ166DRAFT_260237 [Pestalotiopsis sp. NC0098]|nr:hypothetical protein BJ166DRAFT_260237 [Pestalotiopsis sp. NC0098]
MSQWVLLLLPAPWHAAKKASPPTSYIFNIMVCFSCVIKCPVWCVHDLLRFQRVTNCFPRICLFGPFNVCPSGGPRRQWCFVDGPRIHYISCVVECYIRYAMMLLLVQIDLHYYPLVLCSIVSDHDNLSLGWQQQPAVLISEPFLGSSPTFFPPSRDLLQLASPCLKRKSDGKGIELDKRAPPTCHAARLKQLHPMPGIFNVDSILSTTIHTILSRVCSRGSIALLQFWR